jgi:ABC-type nickel/cobalt efflux system permease component RcnA
MYPLGQVIAMTITGSTPRTVLVGALLIVISGGWIAWSVVRQPYSGKGRGAAQGTLTPQS